MSQVLNTIIARGFGADPAKRFTDAYDQRQMNDADLRAAELNRATIAQKQQMNQTDMDAAAAERAGQQDYQNELASVFGEIDQIEPALAEMRSGARQYPGVAERALALNNRLQSLAQRRLLTTASPASLATLLAPPPQRTVRPMAVQRADGKQVFINPDTQEEVLPGMSPLPRETQQTPTSYVLTEKYDPQTGARTTIAVNKRDPDDVVSIGAAAPPASSLAAARKAQIVATKLQSGIANAERNIGNVLRLVDEAKDNTNAWTAGPLGGALKDTWGTPQYDLAVLLRSIVANIGFDKLQAMRRDSPTGGALGQVAVEELRALQSSIQALDQPQTPTQLKAALNAVETNYQEVVAALKIAAEIERDVLTSQADMALGTQASPSAVPQNQPKVGDLIPQQQTAPSAIDYLNRVRPR